MRRLYALSIWHPTAIPLEEYKYRNAKRVVYPLLYGILICLGVGGYVFGIPSLSSYYDETIVDIYCATVSVVALAAFSGVAFPRLWLVDMAANCLLVGQFTSLATALLFLTTDGKDGRAYVLFLAMFVLVILGYRVSILSSEWQIRRLAAEGK